MDLRYGKVQKRDSAKLKSILAIFKKHHLQCGLHGTSLWTPKYKDIDILVFSPKRLVNDFELAIRAIQRKFKAKILEMRGNEKIGYDGDLQIGKMIYRLSYVIIL